MAEISARKKIWGWYFFDWSSQPYYTLVLTFIFGPYFASVAKEFYLAQGLAEEAAKAQAQSFWSLGQTIFGILIAVSAPFLGAFADTAGRRMPYIIVFSLFYVFGAWCLWYVVPDGSTLTWGLIAFGIGFIGAEFTTVFTNSMLPELGTQDEIGEIGGRGYAFGYAGGVLALFIMLLLFAEQSNGKTLIGLDPLLGLDAEAREGTRAVGPFSAIWYAAFMMFFFLWVKEPKRERQPSLMKRALNDLWQTLQSVPRNRSLTAYLTSSLFYRDALAALYGFGGTYAALVLDWTIVQIGVFGIVGAITALVSTWIGGGFDKRLGPKAVIVAMILALITVSTIIVGMSKTSIFGVQLAEGSNLPNIIFYVCGAIIGGAGGVLHSASRTMMCLHATPGRPTEAFGLYALSGKATAFLGPALIFLGTQTTGSARLGFIPVIGLFIIGLILLVWVKKDGERAQP